MREHTELYRALPSDVEASEPVRRSRKSKAATQWGNHGVQFSAARTVHFSSGVDNENFHTHLRKGSSALRLGGFKTHETDEQEDAEQGD